MNTDKPMNLSLLSPGMVAVMIAQFCSALADNAVLIVAFALLKGRGQGDWVPFLQEGFVVPFILLAPFVGVIADGFSKGRVMLWANTIKLSGAVLMAGGASPFLAYSLIGVGATVYSPAKYGILSQMFAPDSLVRANGLLEGSTIAAILLGVLAGGWLADHVMAWAFAFIIGAYALAAIANLFIPRLPAENAVRSFAPLALCRSFTQSTRALVTDSHARFSILGTSMFWGAGMTLRLLMLAWVPVALAITDLQTPSTLMGVVSIGIVLGAAIAGIWISLAKIHRALIGGLLLGPLILALSTVSNIQTAAILMAAIGLGGGIFAVPLNALLQERGHTSVGAGTALAVQNFFENTAMLIFVGAYALANVAGVSVVRIMAGFGLALFLGVLSISVSRIRAAVVAARN